MALIFYHFLLKKGCLLYTLKLLYITYISLNYFLCAYEYRVIVKCIYKMYIVYIYCNSNCYFFYCIRLKIVYILRA